MLHVIHGSRIENVGTLALFCSKCGQRFVCRKGDEPDKQQVVCPKQCAQDTLANVLKSSKAPPLVIPEAPDDMAPPRSTKYENIDVVEFFPGNPRTIEVHGQSLNFASVVPPAFDKAQIQTILKAGIGAVQAVNEYPTCIMAGTVAFDRIAALT